MSSSRTTDIPYTLLDYTGAASEQLTSTPACHFDASPPSANTTIEYSSGNKISKWKSLTGGHELTQHVLTDQPSHQNSNDVNGKYGVHMNTPGSGLYTEDNRHILGAEVTFVVHKPIGSDDNQDVLYRDINDHHSKGTAGDYLITPWGSNNNNQSAMGNTMDAVTLFYQQSVQHHYQYMSPLLGTYNTFPSGATKSDLDIGGIGKVAGFNQNFIDSRQLSVIINTPRPVTVEDKSRAISKVNTRTMWGTYWNVESNANGEASIPWSYRHTESLQNSRYYGLCAGARSDQTHNPFCMVNEVMVFDQTLPVTELNNICDHLVNKWNISNWYGLRQDANTTSPTYL